VEVTKQAHLLLTDMDDPQVELSLLLACLGTAKATYLTRVTHPLTLSLLLRPPLKIPCGLAWDAFARTTSLTLSGCNPGCLSQWKDLA
jgi:endonuclease/exonuclease/phosphatase (EEP) superfamily protein YafD